MTDILTKIKIAGLVGRGGANFSTAAKWEAVKSVKVDKKFVVCNAAEGEPDVAKDGYILAHYPEKVIKGIKLAMEYTGAVKGIIYLNPKYYTKLKSKIKKSIGDSMIEIFAKPKEAGYIGGEESSVLNAIEGKRIEPRLRPPFVSTNGLYGFPTLVNNVETLFNVALVDEGQYNNYRFYTIAGDCLVPGVYELPDNYYIERVLREANNYPDFKFFVQIGGGASGEVLNQNQLERLVTGTGSITIYKFNKQKPLELAERWLDFYFRESCGQCTPCREGVYRLREILDSSEPDWKLFDELVNNLYETAFCGLGASVPVPMRSYMQNVVNANF